jgi:transporter family protein
VFGKIGVRSINSDLATLIRTVIIAVVLFVLVFATGQLRSPGLIGAKVWMFLTLSALATGASWLCYYRALQLGDAARVAPIDKLSVVLVAVFATTFLGERLDLKAWSGIGFIAFGALLLAF